MKQLPIDKKIQPHELAKLAEQYQKEEVKELSFKDISFDLYSEEQFSEFLALIKRVEPRVVVFDNNQLGTLSIERWQALCDNFVEMTLYELTIDWNELYQFSAEHWQILDKLVDTHPLVSLSLQNNDLYSLEPKSFEILYTLIHKLNYPTHISRNNWHMNLIRWGELTTPPSAYVLSASRVGLLTPGRTQEGLNKELIPFSPN